MRNAIKSLFIVLSCLWATASMAGTIYSFTVTNATTAVGTYNVTGGTAECTRAMATGGSNEVTIGSQTFYKFNTSTEWNFTLVGNTLAVGDVITFTCACHATSNKSGKGLIANGVTKTNDFPANTTNTLVYTVAAGDAFDGKTVINVKRADSDIKFGTIEITRGAAVAVTGVTLNKNTTSIEAGHTEQLTATVTPLEATTQTVSWSSSNTAVASVDNNGLVTANSEGTDTITVTTTDGSFTASCIVTVTPSTTPTVDVTGVNLSKYATSLEVGEQETLTATVLPAGATNKAVTWSSSDNTIATVSNGVVTAVAPGTASITVTTVDGNHTASCTVAVTAVPTPPVPVSGLTKHVPEVYEAPTIAGGYGGKLTEVGGYEYEVYYINRDDDSKLSVNLSNVDKQGSICTSTGANSTEAKDGWFTVSSNGSGGDTNGAAADEFQKSIRKINMQSGDEVKLHVEGFDQFSFYGKDNSASTTKCFEVYINDVKQSTTPDNTYSIRRFALYGESVISVKAVGNNSNSNFVAFSLRLAQEPRTKRLSGNDSTQVILQTAAPKPVYYFTKHHNLGETTLEWDGPEATGITLNTYGTGSLLGDTLVLGGQANCAVGTYHYNIVSRYQERETSRVSGSFSVQSAIKATTDTIISVRQGASMKEIKFKYYALNANAVHLTWTNGSTPSGINGNGNNGTYTISGSTSAVVGEYPFTVCVDGGNCVNGKIIVKSSDLGPDPILFLCNKESHADEDIIYKYLKTEKHKNLDVIEVNSTPREQEEYTPYKWIIISEDVDANNPEILAIIQGGVASNKPVLNMKGFAYWSDRLNWGNTVNGCIDTTIMHNNGKLYVQRDDHPIFAGWKSGAIEILEPAKGKQGFMPIEITNSVLNRSLCLATAYTRSKEEYYDEGELQLVMHEVPASLRGGKYICLSLAGNRTLTTEGKTLVERIIEYLTKEEPAEITTPKLEIKQFSINGVDGVIDQMTDTIKVTFMDQEVNLDSLKANVTLLDEKYTFVTPKKDEVVNFSNSTFKPVDFVVSDYISRRTYHVVVMSKSSQDIEEVYEAGQWVNVFDIFGRKVATTNENIYTMDLPRGMYIVVTEGGQTLKIMR